MHIVTTVGTVTLDGSELAFSEQLAPLFREAGFIVDGAGRRLLSEWRARHVQVMWHAAWVIYLILPLGGGAVGVVSAP